MCITEQMNNFINVKEKKPDIVEEQRKLNLKNYTHEKTFEKSIGTIAIVTELKYAK